MRVDVSPDEESEESPDDGQEHIVREKRVLLEYVLCSQEKSKSNGNQGHHEDRNNDLVH